MPRGQHEGHEVSALEAALARRVRRRRDRALVEAVELGDILDQDREVVGVGEEILLESRREAGQSLVELAQARLALLVEPGAGDRELRVVPLDEVP
jgi:hypothetical protein